MYTQYWNLSTKPFENSLDSRFYYPGEAHQGAMLKLRYAVDNRRGAALLAGAAGLGKTLLIQTLARQLEETCSPIVHVVFPQMPADQLVAYLADELAGPQDGNTSLQHSIRRLQRALMSNSEAGRHAIVIIDEAHLLDDSASLETMRLLLNFEHRSKPALTLLLVGHPSLLPTLDRTPELDERIGVKCLLRRFSLDETVSYATHRLNAAGATRPIFESGALEAVHHLSHGVPRRINRLCDLALLIGFAEERGTLGASQIEAVADELVTVAPE